MTYITNFPTPPTENEIPAIMPSPFSDQVHPLAKQASLILQQRLSEKKDWPLDFFSPDGGKMFGVLVIKDSSGRIGFLSAFSAMMKGEWQLPGFVPPVFDQAEQDSYLSAGKRELVRLTGELRALESSIERAELVEKLSHMQQQRDHALAELKKHHNQLQATARVGSRGAAADRRRRRGPRDRGGRRRHFSGVAAKSSARAGSGLGRFRAHARR